MMGDIGHGPLLNTRIIQGYIRDSDYAWFYASSLPHVFPSYVLLCYVKKIGGILN
jgi:hypothetical protein